MVQDICWGVGGAPTPTPCNQPIAVTYGHVFILVEDQLNHVYIQVGDVRATTPPPVTNQLL